MFELNRERRKNGNSEKLSKGNEKRRWNWGNCKQFVDDVDEIFFMITIISSTESCVRLENIIWEKNIFCWNIPSEPLTVAIRFHISLLFTFFLPRFISLVFFGRRQCYCNERTWVRSYVERRRVLRSESECFVFTLYPRNLLAHTMESGKNISQDSIFFSFALLACNNGIPLCGVKK